MSTTLELRVGALVNGLGAALCEALTKAEEDTGVTAPKLCTVMPGVVVALDYCAEGGMAWSRLVQITPFVSQQGRVCTFSYDITVELSVMRCAPVIEEDGELPTNEEQLATAMLQNFDMGLMHNVLTCYNAGANMTFTEMGAFVPFGPDGQCVGGAWTATWRTE
jgi:flagellar biosynthesis protein FliQ